MKTLNLSSYDVKELSEAQMSEVNGGEPITVATVLAIAALAIYLYDNREAFKEGLKEGYEAGKSVFD